MGRLHEDDYQDFLKNMRNNNVYKRIDKVCRKNGYALSEAYWMYDGSGKRTLTVRIASDLDYNPAIQYGDRGFLVVPPFSASTMSLDEIKDFQQGLNNAAEVLNYLKQADLDMLYTYGE